MPTATRPPFVRSPSFMTSRFPLFFAWAFVDFSLVHFVILHHREDAPPLSFFSRAMRFFFVLFLEIRDVAQDRFPPSLPTLPLRLCMVPPLPCSPCQYFCIFRGVFHAGRFPRLASFARAAGGGGLFECESLARMGHFVVLCVCHLIRCRTVAHGWVDTVRV